MYGWTGRGGLNRFPPVCRLPVEVRPPARGRDCPLCPRTGGGIAGHMRAELDADVFGGVAGVWGLEVVPDMGRQEVYGYLLTHCALSVLLCRAATEADVDPDRVKFSSRLCWCGTTPTHKGGRYCERSSAAARHARS